MLKFLIFDWDGTLIDSADRIIASMQQAAVDLGLKEPGNETVRNIIGLGLPEALQSIFPGIDEQGIAGMRERYSYYYLQADNTPTALFPGVQQGSLQLAQKGYQLAVATGKSRRGLEHVFAETGLKQMFQHSRCADETRSKPHPLMLHELLQESGYQAHEALMIGDTEFDLEMAINANVSSMGVAYGAHSPQRLQTHNPVTIIDQFSELDCWLDKHNLSN